MKKKTYASAFLALALLTSFESSASSRPLDFSRSAWSSGFFSSVQYKPAFPQISGFSVSAAGNPLHVFSMKEDSKTELPKTDKNSFGKRHLPSYLKNTKSIAVSAGYASSIARIEVEGWYQQFPLDVKQFQSQSNAYVIAAQAQGTQQNANTLGDKYVTMENKGITIASLVVNACYDLFSESSKVSPSACAGIGGGLVTFLGVVAPRWQYQAKLGLQYVTSAKTVLFVYGNVNKVHTKTFKAIPAEQQHIANSSENLYPVADINLLYLGAELGIRLIL